jgi:hypothetical protein
MKPPPVSYARRDMRPVGAIRVAEERMRDFVRMFGYVMACGAAMDLHRFAVSCYLQGCEDMAHAVIEEKATK